MVGLPDGFRPLKSSIAIGALPGALMVRGVGAAANRGHVPPRNCAGLIDDAPEPARPSNQFLGEKGASGVRAK